MIELKDRVVINDGLFHVLAGETDCELFYGCTFLKDEIDAVPSMEPIQYWDSMSAIEIKPKSPGCFLHLEERRNGEVVDNCKLFIPAAKKGGILRIIMDKPFRYGKNACRITICWENCPAEAINREYIWLEDIDGKKYQFLVNHIEPLESKKSELKDQYIFTIPDGKHLSDYHVSFDPILKEKYKVIAD